MTRLYRQRVRSATHECSHQYVLLSTEIESEHCTCNDLAWLPGDPLRSTHGLAERLRKEDIVKDVPSSVQVVSLNTS